MEIEIVSGFLGAGKTTFLNKYLPLLEGKTAVIENESGEISLNRSLLREDVLVKDLYAGCICCSLALELRKTIREIIEIDHPVRIILEPSGIGRLSDIADACMRAGKGTMSGQVDIKSIVLVDLAAFEECEEAFGDFYLDQIEHADFLFFSGLDSVESEQKKLLIKRVRGYNPTASFYEDDWRGLDGDGLLEMIQPKDRGWKRIINKGRLKNASR